METNQLNSSDNIRECEACGVKINSKDEVLFSYGKPGTLARLKARVCDNAKDSKCINQDFDGKIRDYDKWIPL